jgi:hypothetical protein
MATKTKEITLSFTREKDTKNTIRFMADGHEDVTYVYIAKTADKKLGSPDKISMTIKAG